MTKVEKKRGIKEVVKEVLKEKAPVTFVTIKVTNRSRSFARRLAAESGRPMYEEVEAALAFQVEELAVVLPRRPVKRRSRRS